VAQLSVNPRGDSNISDRVLRANHSAHQPRTRNYLISKFGFASAAALDYYLTPLRQDNLIRQHLDDGGTQVFEWSNLFKRLPKKTIKEILDGRDSCNASSAEKKRQAVKR
jgi:hypothetical protein